MSDPAPAGFQFLNMVQFGSGRIWNSQNQYKSSTTLKVKGKGLVVWSQVQRPNHYTTEPPVTPK